MTRKSLWYVNVIIGLKEEDIAICDNITAMNKAFCHPIMHWMDHLVQSLQCYQHSKHYVLFFWSSVRELNLDDMMRNFENEKSRLLQIQTSLVQQPGKFLWDWFWPFTLEYGGSQLSCRHVLAVQKQQVREYSSNLIIWTFVAWVTKWYAMAINNLVNMNNYCRQFPINFEISILVTPREMREQPWCAMRKRLFPCQKTVYSKANWI